MQEFMIDCFFSLMTDTDLSSDVWDFRNRIWQIDIFYCAASTDLVLQP